MARDAQGRYAKNAPTRVAIERADQSLYHDVGTTGLVTHGGYIQDEFLPELRWPQAGRIFREMSDNDAVAGSLLTAIDLTVRRAELVIDPADDTPQAQEAADFIESCLTDLDTPWADAYAGFLTFLPYGFACAELVYKKRQGERAQQPSKYADGKVGWAHLPIRSQETLLRWNRDPATDRLTSVTQQAVGHQVVDIPYEKLLHFRTTAVKDSPLGSSILRRAYVSWFRKRRIEDIEAVGIERDLAGIPIAWVPPHILQANDPQSTIIKNAMIDAATKTRRNEAEGLLMPLEYDENGHKLYDFTLLTTAGKRQFDTSAIVTRLEQRMLMTALADFIMLGHEGVGGLGLNVGTVKIDLFLASCEVWNDVIAAQMQGGVRKLCALNGIRPELVPKFGFGSLQNVNVQEIAQTLLTLAQAGAPSAVSPEAVIWFLDELGIPHESLDAPAA